MEGSVNDSISNLRPLNILLKYLYETLTNSSALDSIYRNIFLIYCCIGYAG